MPSNSDIQAFIKAEGWLDHAVISAGVVQEALKKHEVVFEEWVARGFQADMTYLETMQGDRFHPENKLPDIKSVIVLTAWYAGNSVSAKVEQKISSIKKGKVARYAGGRDYHKVLKKKLLQLSAFLKEQYPQAETYASVDSGPTVDRVLAETGGLGFFGKNANIISPSRGSYFFIASLMTNIELPSTEKRRMPNCGDCRRCIEACPTGAITAPGKIDARKCIAYLTIENKEGIPLEYRTQIGDRLFGCDICQEVCPFNEGRAHRQSITMGDLDSDKGAGSSLGLAEILAIKNDEVFTKLFAGTPLMRAKRRGLVRNACIVAGNSGDPSLIPALKRLLEHEEDPMLKEHAQWGIDQLSQ